MLLVVRTKSAIVGTAVFDRCVPVQRHLWRLEEDFTAAAVVVYVVSHQHTFKAVLGTPFQHVNTVVLEDDFGVDSAETRSAE